MEKEIPIDAVVDEPQNGDYNRHEFEEFAEGDRKTARPDEYIELFDQGNSSLCTRYSLTAIINAYNILEDINTEWKPIRDQIDPSYPDDWIRSLQRRVDDAKKAGLIEGYVAIQKVWWKYPNGTVQTKETRLQQIKKALDSGYFLYTGSDKVDWSAWWKNPIISWKSSGVGHAFDLVASNETYHSTGNLIKIANSFGRDYADNGYNYINESDIDRLFTVYVIIDKKDSAFFQTFKQQQKAKQLIAIAKDLYENANAEQKAWFMEKKIGDWIKKLYLL